MGDQRARDRCGVAGLVVDHIQATSGEPGLLEDITQSPEALRGELGAFEDDCVTGSEGQCNCASTQDEGGIPIASASTHEASQVVGNERVTHHGAIPKITPYGSLNTIAPSPSIVTLGTTPSIVGILAAKSLMKLTPILKVISENGRPAPVSSRWY